MNLFEKALKFATETHKGQLDKGGKFYIEHPKRVADQFKDEKLRVIAILHDVVEDTSVYLSEIAREFGVDIALEVDALTRRGDESYMQYIYRVSQSSLASQVKIADLKDNMNLSRLPVVTKEDLSRFRKYEKALSILEGIYRRENRCLWILNH